MPASVPELVPLESGDHLTREEFHRRYCLRTDIKRAELIRGVVYVASPMRHSVHARQQSLVSGWLEYFSAHTPGVEAGAGGTIFMADDEVQPDAYLFYTSPPSGERRVWLDDEGYLHGAPELIVEIAASSAAYDLHEKLEIYLRSGVREYVVWQIYERRID